MILHRQPSVVRSPILVNEELIRDITFLSTHSGECFRPRPASYLDGCRGHLEESEGIVPDVKENDERMGLQYASLRYLRCKDLVCGLGLRFFEYYGRPSLLEYRGWS